MAKGRSQQRQKTRDTSTITNQRLRFENLIKPLPTISISNISKTLSQIEDRRTWHPSGSFRNARSFNNPYHVLVAPRPRVKLKTHSYPTHQVGFYQPKKVLICVRRQTRKEVLHAFNKTGKGGQRRPRRTYYSSVSCRR